MENEFNHLLALNLTFSHVVQRTPTSDREPSPEMFVFLTERSRTRSGAIGSCDRIGLLLAGTADDGRELPLQ